MIRISKYFMIDVIFFSLMACLYSYGAAEANSSGTDLNIEKGHISAELTNAPVLVLVRQIESQGGIWFKALADLAGEKVSVRFADIPLDEGLKRILRGMNHSLVYGADGRIAGVYILGKGGKSRGKSVFEPVPVNTHERKPFKTTTVPVKNVVSSRILNVRIVNLFNLPRATSDMRMKSLDMSLNLNSLMLV